MIPVRSVVACGDWRLCGRAPTAYAVGYRIAPLRGFAAVSPRFAALHSAVIGSAELLNSWHTA
jgi:hypothetical protein